VELTPYFERVELTPYFERVELTPYFERVELTPYFERVEPTPYFERVELTPYFERVELTPYFERVELTPYFERVALAGRGGPAGRAFLRAGSPEGGAIPAGSGRCVVTQQFTPAPVPTCPRSTCPVRTRHRSAAATKAPGLPRHGRTKVEPCPSRSR
jgi:hypothetical protein